MQFSQRYDAWKVLNAHEGAGYYGGQLILKGAIMNGALLVEHTIANPTMRLSQLSIIKPIQ